MILRINSGLMLLALPFFAASFDEMKQLRLENLRMKNRKLKIELTKLEKIGEYPNFLDSLLCFDVFLKIRIPSIFLIN